MPILEPTRVKEHNQLSVKSEPPISERSEQHMLLTCFTCEEMGHYASFYDQTRTPPPVIAHAGPVHASRALPANMVSVLEDYYWSETEDSTMSVSAIIKMGAQKAGKEPKAGANVPQLQQAVDQSIFDDDEESTRVRDMDELEDTSVSTEVQHMVPSFPQKSQQIP